MSDQLQNKKALIAAGAALAVLLIGGWFLLVGPQRSKAADLAQQLDAARATLVQRQDALHHPAAKVTIRASDGYRLATALPKSVDMTERRRRRSRFWNHRGCGPRLGGSSKPRSF